MWVGEILSRLSVGLLGLCVRRGPPDTAAEPPCRVRSRARFVPRHRRASGRQGLAPSATSSSAELHPCGHRVGHTAGPSLQERPRVGERGSERPPCWFSRIAEGLRRGCVCRSAAHCPPGLILSVCHRNWPVPSPLPSSTFPAGLKGSRDGEPVDGGRSLPWETPGCSSSSSRRIQIVAAR